MTDNNSTKPDGEALLKLVNVLADTPDNWLSSLTRIERRTVLPLSVMHMKNDILDPARTMKDAEGEPLRYDDGSLRKVPLAKLWLGHYYRLERSVDKWYFMLLTGLAHEQASAEIEKGEDFELE